MSDRRGGRRKRIGCGLLRALALAAAGAALAAATATATVPAPLTVGAGKATIQIPPALLPLQGFGVVHDPLQVRVVLIDNGATRVALVDVDLTAIFDSTVQELQGIVARVGHLQASHVWICASHTFSAPHVAPAATGGPNQLGGGFNSGSAQDQRKAAQFHVAVDTAVERAVAAAVQGLRPAQMAYGVGRADVNVNRDVLTPQGWWLGVNDSGPSDKSVGVLRFEDRQHQPIAVLMNYAVQPAILRETLIGGTMPITADLAGAAAGYVEQQYGGDTVALFLVGADADQVPTYAAQHTVLDKDGRLQLIDLGAQAYPLLDWLGERLGAEVVRVSQGLSGSDSAAATTAPVALRVLNGSVSLDAQYLPPALWKEGHATRSYHYRITGKAPAPYSILQIGAVVLVGVQVELSSAMGESLKQHSPFPDTLVVNMVNGAAKYLPDADSYRKIQYEAMNALYGPGSAEILAGQILQSLQTLRAEGPK